MVRAADPTTKAFLVGSAVRTVPLITSFRAFPSSG